MANVVVPDGSIYFWMYEQGLKHISFQDVEAAVHTAGKEIRKKDCDNYWNGYYKSDLYHSPASEDIWLLKQHATSTSVSNVFFDTPYDEYETHPYYGLGYPEIENRWVPCNKDNKPMIKWGKGCMSLADAVAYKDQIYLAENLKGTRFVVIDCDGDHGEELDEETIAFLRHYAHMTHCINRPDGMISFHLTFWTDKIIPTMHFPYAHIDIAGNRRNQLRYWKNKTWNGIKPAKMTDEIWSELVKYIKYRKEKANA